MNWVGLFLIAGGLFSVVGALLDWDWFMNHYKARFLVKIMGRMGARIFYMVLGSALIVFGVLVTAGVIEDDRQSMGPAVEHPVVVAWAEAAAP